MENKKFWKENRGQVSFFLVWLFIITVFLVFFLFFVPWCIQFNTALFRNAEFAFDHAQADINAISDAGVKASLNTSVGNSKAIITESTDNLNDYFQYSWILIPIIVTVIFFVQTRRSVEAGLI